MDLEGRKNRGCVGKLGIEFGNDIGEINVGRRRRQGWCILCVFQSKFGGIKEILEKIGCDVGRVCFID